MARGDGCNIPSDAGCGCSLTPGDGALVIFTTGSTGSPKPALLSHRNITVQNMCMCGAFLAATAAPALWSICLRLT